ncbi:hypothetical protein [Vibrio furnissii]|uniref:hypothetical protein n=1 Tax=Vibrio furnissii TaxID=29494 RepID=UPI0020C18DC4|nr:hypothetical protein [Vibrio furnissii]
MSNIDLRVGEVFESELHYELEPFNDKFRFVIFQNGKAEAATWFEDQAEAICIAVNQYSKLATITKQRDELADALESLAVEWLPIGAHESRVREAKQLLSTIKEQKGSN